jgi:hypothetical protein
MIWAGSGLWWLRLLSGGRRDDLRRPIGTARAMGRTGLTSRMYIRREDIEKDGPAGARCFDGNNFLMFLMTVKRGCRGGCVRGSSPVPSVGGHRRARAATAGVHLDPTIVSFQGNLSYSYHRRSMTLGHVACPTGSGVGLPMRLLA